MVYDWPEYARSPEDDLADPEKPKTNMGAMYLVRFGSQSYDRVDRGPAALPGRAGPADLRLAARRHRIRADIDRILASWT